MIEVPHFVPARQDFVIPGLRPPVTHDLEHPEYLNPEDFIIPLAPTPNNYPDLPYHLRKYVLKRVAIENGGVLPELPLWNERAVWIERRVQRLIAGLPGVKSVTKHEKGSEDDAIRHDFTGQLVNGFRFYGQTKSSGDGIIQFKKALRNAYSPGKLNHEGQVRRAMADLRIILINGSETRSDEEIINDSFYPQLERTINRAQELQYNLEHLRERIGTILRGRTSTQVFPAPVSD
jgi:hypothetical protein